MGFVMVGAAGFVHVRHGVFVGAGGWELVGSIAGALLALAAAGPGRFSLAHLLRARPPRPAAAEPPRRARRRSAREQEVIPPPGLPVTPLIRLDPASRARWRPRFPQPVSSEPEPAGAVAEHRRSDTRCAGTDRGE